jgi:TIGR03009 family protein
MRPLGFTVVVLLIGVTIAGAQQPVNGGVKAAPQIVPAGAPGPNPLDTHLANWEQRMADVKNFRVEMAVTKTDGVFKKDKKYNGVVLCMKPNLAILRLEYTADATKNDYEAYICNGRSVYQYDGLAKLITEYPLPNPANDPSGSSNNLMLDFLTGLKAREAKARFDMTLVKEDDYYIYLDIKPLLGRDKEDFLQLRLALFGPKTKFAYLPAQVYKSNPNGDSEMWSFTNPQINLPGIDEKIFQYVKVPGFTERVAPPAKPAAFPPQRPGQPPVIPGATGLPAGPGQVRP